MKEGKIQEICRNINKNKLWDKLQNIEIIFMGCILFVIVSLLLTFGEQQYMCKQFFDYSNGVLLLIGGGCCGFATFVLFRYKTTIWQRLKQIENKFSYVLIIYFFIIMYVSYNVKFCPGWDAGVVLGTSKQILNDNLEPFNNYYYSIYPNNLLITCIYTLVFECNDMFGIFNGENEIMALISVGCLLQTITAYLTFKILCDIMPSHYSAWIMWVVYLVFMGISWVLVPYTDAIGVVIPISIFTLYLEQKNKEKIVNCFFIGCLVFVGYHIKPQTIVIAIAIFIFEVTKSFFRNKKENLLFIKKMCLCMVATGVCASLYGNIIIPSTGFELNEELELGMEHSFMMGLNLERSGVYAPDDIAFSESISTKKERKAVNITEAKMRIKTMLENGTFSEHVVKKALVNFNDGSFAWGQEGKFIKQEYSNPNQLISPLLKKIIYPSGENRHYVYTLKQMMWIVILFSSIGIVLLTRSDFSKKEEIVVICLAVMGIYLFVMLFESRARYLYTYLPFFVILAGIGFYKIQELVRKIHLLKKEQNNNT